MGRDAPDINRASDQAYRRASLLLALLTTLVYALCSDGTLTVDPLSRWRVSESVVERGTVALSEAGVHTIEHEGRHYDVFLPGQSIELLPFAALAMGAREVLGVDAGTASFAGRFLVCTVYVPLVCALVVLGYLAVLHRLEVRPRVALASGMVLAFGTPLYVWGTRGSEEPTVAALAIWALWALIDANRGAPVDAGSATRRDANRLVDRLGLAGVLLAFGLLHRAPFVSVCMGLLVLAIPLMVRQRRLLAMAAGRFTLWTIAVVLMLSIAPLYDWLRFGDPLDTGYARYFAAHVGGIWDTPLLTGLQGLLISPGKSVFLYVPWMVLLPVAFIPHAVRRRLGLLTWCIVLIVALHLVIYALHTYWHGAFGWGVRFHVSLMPILLVPIAVLIDVTRATIGRGVLLGVLAILSVIVQLAGVSFNWGLELRQHPEHYGGWLGVEPQDAAWTWEGSQLRLRFRNVGRKLLGRDVIDGVGEDDPERIMTVWNTFALRAAQRPELGKLNVMLWALWWGLLILAVLAGWALWGQWRRVPAT